MDPLEVSLDLDVDGNTTLNGESSEEMSNSQKPTQPLYNNESESDDDDEDDDDYDESCVSIKLGIKPFWAFRNLQ